MMLNGTVFGVNGPMPRNTDTEETRHEYANVTYETPKIPGTVFSAEDDGSGYVEPDAEGDEEDGTGALMRLRGTHPSGNGSPVNGSLNANGKRSLGPGSLGGRSAGPKIFREGR